MTIKQQKNGYYADMHESFFKPSKLYQSPCLFYIIYFNLKKLIEISTFKISYN